MGPTVMAASIPQPANSSSDSLDRRTAHLADASNLGQALGMRAVLMCQPAVRTLGALSDRHTEMTAIPVHLATYQHWPALKSLVRALSQPVAVQESRRDLADADVLVVSHAIPKILAVFCETCTPDPHSWVELQNRPTRILILGHKVCARGRESLSATPSKRTTWHVLFANDGECRGRTSPALDLTGAIERQIWIVHC